MLNNFINNPFITKLINDVRDLQICPRLLSSGVSAGKRTRELSDTNESDETPLLQAGGHLSTENERKDRK